MNKKTMLLIFIPFVFLSCTKKKLKNEVDYLESKVINLQNNLDECETRVSELIDELEDCNQERLESSYSSTQNQVITDFYKKKLDDYMYGTGVSLSRHLKDGEYVTIYGAENIIDFLNKHYCP